MSAVLTLCATGLAMGVFHVLTGADHLSAIATLSVNVGDFRAFWYGIRWGIGHSIGLVLVGSTFIALENIHYGHAQDGDGDVSSDRVIEVPESIENLAACFVGIFMLALGLHNLHGARRRWRERKKSRQHGRRRCRHQRCDHAHDENDGEVTGRLSCDALADAATTKSVGNYGGDNDPSPSLSMLTDPTGLVIVDGPARDGDGEKDEVVSKRFLSLWIGIFHGAAGPGGVLGVVPAIKLHDPWRAAAYLGSFCLSSIAAMGSFAALYGSLSAVLARDNDRLAYGMEVFSASLSVLVGCTWLILLHLGILDDVFP